jgi:hypothetical protein
VASEGLDKVDNGKSLLNGTLMSNDKGSQLFIFLILISLYVDILVVIFDDGFEAEDDVVGTDLLDLIESKCVDVGVDIDI